MESFLHNVAARPMSQSGQKVKYPVSESQKENANVPQTGKTPTLPSGPPGRVVAVIAVGGRSLPVIAVHPQVKLLAATLNADDIAALAARQCYLPGSVLDREGPLPEKTRTRLLGRTISSGHHSVIEHNVFTFGIRGISRACSHQLVRHRIGFSYDQQSQRFVDFTRTEFIEIVVPPNILRRADMLAAFLQPVEASVRSYFALVSAGIAPEDARFTLPNAFETKLVVSANARALLHFFELRTCQRAQWEIRWLANLMLREVRRVAPGIFRFAGPTCVTEGICWERDGRDCPRLSRSGAEWRQRRVAWTAEEGLDVRESGTRADHGS